MKITTKGRYGLTITLELAKRIGDGPISLRSIAQDKNLSEHYLEQLIGPLRNAGIVKSIRGAHGGYVLNGDPEKLLQVTSSAHWKARLYLSKVWKMKKLLSVNYGHECAMLSVTC